jgi:zinc D-Ala-D-Ala carboxypeptidase
MVLMCIVSLQEIKLVNYFKESEFACRCCGVAKMQQSTIDKLIKAREIAGIPFVINSGYRCEAHNASVGGKSEGAHTSGYAVDIKATDSRSRFLILDAVLKAGFNRIGIAKTFIHIDNDPKVVWEY